MKKLKYKFLREGLKSDSGNLTWELGKWVHQTGDLDICHNGLHCSLYPDQAFGFVQGEIVALVETKGKSNAEKTLKKIGNFYEDPEFTNSLEEK